MIYEILKNEREFDELISKVQGLTSTADTKDYLKSSLTAAYENKKTAEFDIIKYSIKILISTFIYIILCSSNIDDLSVGFIKIKDLTLIKLFFPIVILYYTLLMASVDLARHQNSISYYVIQAALYPEVVTKNLCDLFVPFSLIELLSKPGSTNALVNFLTRISYFLIFGLTTFIGLFIFGYSLYYSIKQNLTGTLLFRLSFFFQLAILFLVISISTRKVKLKFAIKRK